MPSITHATLTPEHAIPTAEDFGLLPKAFAPPESGSAAFPPDINPVSFHPPQTGADGQRIERFHDFRNDPLFTQSTLALADRLDELSRFASAQCGRQGPIVTGALETFKRKLQERPDPHFGDALPVIYGAGKRGLDEFCALMRQPGIDAAARRVTLQEFASKLDRCGAYVGESMVRLPLALRLAQGGLHARHGQLMEHVTEQTLLSLVRNPRLDGRPLAPGMEPHIVQQLRRELGLPGGANEDHFANSQLVSSRLIGHALEALKFEFHPGKMACRLAVDAMEELKAGLRKELGDDLSTVDPMDAHALPFQRALDALNERYGGIRSASLVQARDEAFTAGKITTDPSLVALDLREEMARLELAPKAYRQAIAAWKEAGGETSLCHVDGRICFQSHRSPGRAEPELSPVTVASLAHVPDSPAHLQAEDWRLSLATAVIECAPAEELGGLAPEWLLTEQLHTHFFDRLPPAEIQRWLARTDLPAKTQILLSKSQAGARAKAQALQRQREVLINTVEAALHDNDAMRLSAFMRQCLRECPDHLAAALEQQTPGPLAQALSAGQSEIADVLIAALHSLAVEGHLTSKAYGDVLRRSLTREALTHADAWESWLGAVEAAKRDEFLSTRTVDALVTRCGIPGAPSWLGNPPRPTPDTIKGWMSLMSKAIEFAIVSPDTVRTVLKSSLFRFAVKSSDASFPTLIAGCIDAARLGVLTSDDLMQLMRSPGPVNTLGIGIGSPDMALALTDSALEACRQQVFTNEQCLELIAPGYPPELPVSFFSEFSEGAFGEWKGRYLSRLVIAVRDSVLPLDTFTAMLMRKDTQGQPRLKGVSKDTVARLRGAVDELRQFELVTRKEAARLKSSIDKAARVK